MQGESIDGIVFLALVLLVPVGIVISIARTKGKKLRSDLAEKELAIRAEYHEKSIALDSKRADLDRKAEEFGSLEKAIEGLAERRKVADSELVEVSDMLTKSRMEYERVDQETTDLQRLKLNADTIALQKEHDLQELDTLKSQLIEYRTKETAGHRELRQVMSKLDLYSRLEEFVDFGHFELPEYLYETSERFAAEIKKLRQDQKAMLKDRSAFTQHGEVVITGDERQDKRIIEGQMKLVMRAFNIETDILIGKVSPSNLERTLSQIEKVASDLEKLVASLRCGLSTDYVALRYEECGIQYQYALKKKEEAEEQRLIREQMREEAKAEKEYRAAIDAAQREEDMYQDILARAKQELEQATAEERAIAEAKVADLEQRLLEAEAAKERTKSLAEQTRRGYVYVISNIGSFGENVYKIGMTRRLDPMDRVKELGDASVPFSFDVHALIFSDDAPAMETALHRKFSHHRVNAVNLRKEFFHVDLESIREAVYEIGHDDADFKTTIAAEEYFESQRLREQVAA
ncbi:DUF4041 domain-containing protein [Cobetia sp. 1AS1]|uniref:DUF4041 domain-containing protein n=1 Tax=Cobetia sp. 1AS1 TaxID=3040016 RepID=UPI00244AD294|nr:DUF4041 domain-containing protein [Cobetia sp. 1AS1]MDH2296043.1 DUF4041 domain-containing protein [Cobetia sp. 1AS1]